MLVRSGVRLWAVAIGIAAVACIVLTACSGASGSAAQKFRFTSATERGATIALADREPAAPVTGTFFDGTPFTLVADAGKVVVINFWAAWCPDCRIETPQFDALYREMKGQGVDFVGVDTKEVSRGSATSFIADNEISYPMVWDEPGKTAVQLGHVPASGLPFTVVIDKHQRVAAVYIGIQSPADLRPVLASLVAESG